ncbi:methylglyoxal reductase (NADPH-dependent) gre2 [Physocladia obscura]|uniref:Methylglyoxal reductase (NADPH-dependent) gre2 n=1 Tax=Physocladia obscura TaxID=109957 RepID=A0AAD5SWK9_9FUNG|nr:methylglyoxal reductase (NADPH-dependent) gre2 [Physocladia obscura]
MTTTVLVSGVSGYIGCHVARELLQQGFSVRGTVRSPEKTEQVREVLLQFTTYPAQISFAIVKDIGEPSAFDEAVVGVDYIIHTASPVHLGPVTDAKRELIDPAVNGTIGILNSATKVPSIRRVVITSSVAAIRGNTSILPEGLSELDWNSDAVEAFEKDGIASYPASKTIAEQAAWNFVRDKKPSFDIATINPSFVFGPAIHPCASTAALNATVKIISDFYLFNTTQINPASAAHYVDVRDVARAHVLAITVPAASGQRFVVSNGSFTHEAIIAVLKKNFPGRPYATGSTTATVYPVLNSKSLSVLGLGEYIPFEKMIVDTVNSIKARFNV